MILVLFQEKIEGVGHKKKGQVAEIKVVASTAEAEKIIRSDVVHAVVFLSERAADKAKALRENYPEIYGGPTLVIVFTTGTPDDVIFLDRPWAIQLAKQLATCV